VLIPTAIDTARFTPLPDPAQHGPSLGWVGHSDNLGYLESLHGALQELTRRRPGLRLVVVADRPPRLPGIDVEFRPWRLDREIDGFRGFRVGLMPLVDSPWARAKCAFKAIQYMALGIPTVASAVGTNVELIEHGESGFLARSPAEWVEVLDALLGNDELARTIGRAGRRRIEEAYALERVSRELVRALEGLCGKLPGRRPRGYVGAGSSG
jgi:glycosyltransferase involved in cell wall biosynthesis